MHICLRAPLFPSRNNQRPTDVPRAMSLFCDGDTTNVPSQTRDQRLPTRQRCRARHLDHSIEMATGPSSLEQRSVRPRMRRFHDHAPGSWQVELLRSTVEGKAWTRSAAYLETPSTSNGPLAGRHAASSRCGTHGRILNDSREHPRKTDEVPLGAHQGSSPSPDKDAQRSKSAQLERRKRPLEGTVALGLGALRRALDTLLGPSATSSSWSRSSRSSVEAWE